MKKNRILIYHSQQKLLLVILLLLINYLCIYPQENKTENNLEVMFKLIDSAVTKINSVLPDDEKNIFLNLNLTGDYSIFNNRIISSFKKTNRNILLENQGSVPEIKYSIPQVKVNYSEILKGGLFGSYKVKREVFLDNNYSFVKNGEVRKADSFKEFSTDTISYDNLSSLEISNMPFTKAEQPSEPFLSSLIEPAIAIGAAAITVFLFFTVRSK